MLWLASACAGLAALLALGTVAWQTPWLGFVGSVGGHVPGWMVVVAALGAATGVMAWTHDHSVGSMGATAVSSLAGVAGAKVLADQVRALRQLGVRASWGDFFGPLRGVALGPDAVVTLGPVGSFTPRVGVFGPPGMQTPRGVVVHIHGGGWAGGNEASDVVHVRQLAARGFLVFTPTYALAAPGAPTWELAPRHIAHALVAVRRIAPAYGGIADEVFLSGSSAGAHLALLVANRVAIGDTFELSNVSMPTIGAVAVTVPAIDPAAGQENQFVPGGAIGRRMIDAFVGGSVTEVPERHAAVDAAAHVTSASPPALLVYGPCDWIAPSLGVAMYALRCRQHGVEVRDVPIPWTGHLVKMSGAATRAGVELTSSWFQAHTRGS
ncbi:alpha/beta hydrolase [Demequina sp.]|uniref:alpha/beta hydrolase n=1 Tax=Demequina sp. TaxID=2050685 RepID=UPI003A87E95A